MHRKQKSKNSLWNFQIKKKPVHLRNISVKIINFYVFNTLRVYTNKGMIKKYKLLYLKELKHWQLIGGRCDYTEQFNGMICALADHKFNVRSQKTQRARENSLQSVPTRSMVELLKFQNRLSSLMLLYSLISSSCRRYSSSCSPALTSHHKQNRSHINSFY